MDIVSVHEDSHHLRIAFGTRDPDQWNLITVGQGAGVGAIEDVAIGDINGDGWPDLVAACEEAHLAYFQNPGEDIRSRHWPRLIPMLTQGRGSWLRVFVVDLNKDGRMDIVGANKGTADIIDQSVAGAAADRPTSLFVIKGDPRLAWRRHDISRRVRGMYDRFIPRDMDGDGDIDFVATRGNSGNFDGVLWLEQVRSAKPQAAFSPARAQESRALPLPPENWIEQYDKNVSYVAPNKAVQDAARKE